ncbi:hypothetical protein SLEP1_g31607 [Rubroshorea leprosula]|uniref:Uncharacterized protein n=1 Tax=Rubroshorea leprosula TaxID=152421 RepID=A0AAV5K3U4_9ROSI|nr:hypothetical protein SLEP1_g31607 [Rubroshorea leprosula]
MSLSTPLPVSPSLPDSHLTFLRLQPFLITSMHLFSGIFDV